MSKRKAANHDSSSCSDEDEKSQMAVQTKKARTSMALDYREQTTSTVSGNRIGKSAQALLFGRQQWHQDIMDMEKQESPLDCEELPDFARYELPLLASSNGTSRVEQAVVPQGHPSACVFPQDFLFGDQSGTIGQHIATAADLTDLEFEF